MFWSVGRLQGKSGRGSIIASGVLSQISEKKPNQNVLLWVFNNGSEISNLISKFSFKNDNKNVLSARFFIPTKLANFAPLRYRGMVAQYSHKK